MVKTHLNRSFVGSLAAGMVLLAAGGVALGDLPLQNSITQYGITWTFSQAVPVGQFVNGDYYVVGPATITSISPLPTYNAAAGTARNGSVLNLTTNKGYTGFDDRLEAGRYSPTFDAHLPIAIKPGDSLISSVSVTTPGLIPNMFRPSDYSPDPIATQAILTVLSAQVPADTFRPSYLDRSQTQLYHAGDLQWNLLPNLPLTGIRQYSENNIAMTPSNVATMFQRPWVDTIEFGFAAGMQNMPVYGREISRLAGAGTLLLESNYTQAQKHDLLINMTQVGIDLWGMVKAGYPGWEAFGGHNSGRKWLIEFAGKMLGDAAMSKPSQTFPNVNFQEDMQTAYGPAWTGANVVYTGHYGTAGTGIYGPYEQLQPKDWPGSLGENYRRCCTSSAWVGEALAAMILGVKGDWNQPAFFDYVDRWMTEDDTSAVQTILQQTGLDYSADFMRQKEVWDPFIQDMWNKYRNALPVATNNFTWAGHTNNTWTTLATEYNWTANAGGFWINAANRATPNNAIFDLATPAAVTVNNNLDLGSITFTTGGWTLNAGAGVLTHGGTGAINITTTAGTSTINAVIADGSTFGSGGGITSLTKSGPGILILGGANSYHGLTTVSGGTLLVSNITGSATGSGNVTLNGGTLGGRGTIAGAVIAGTGPHTIYPSATLTGSGTGTLTVGGLTSNANTTLAFNLTTPGSSSVSDRIRVTGVGALTLNGGSLQVAKTTTGAPSLGYYKIIQYSGTIQGAGPSSLTLPATTNNVAYTLDSNHDAGFIDIHRGFLGDADDNGVVNFDDFLILSQNFGQAGGWSQANFDGSATVDFNDFLTLSQHFGESILPGSLAAAADELAAFQNASTLAFDGTGVPEPTSLALLGVGAMALLFRRRSQRKEIRQRQPFDLFWD